MTIWIVTTGNSDVILKHDRSWGLLHEKALEKLECWDFGSLNKIEYVGRDTEYNMAARVLGLVYEDELDNNFDDLSFPLLDTFTKYLTANNDHQNLQVNKIILILTNQDKVFNSNEISNAKCPYWQDTCKLEPIFKKYFQVRFPHFKGEIEYLQLQPNDFSEGLDNWDKCLNLVNDLFQIKIVNIDKKEKLLVSHQAGTPAISSAVQFASLARFEKKVEFLVSNEHRRHNAILISGSNYLKALKLQEAKELLDRYDYSGVEKIFDQLYAKEFDQEGLEKKELIKKLLKIAIEWNNSNFDQFSQEIAEINQESMQSIINDTKIRTKEWWWSAYEAGYLAVIKLRNGNYVEALFHSFRAVEGLLKYKGAVEGLLKYKDSNSVDYKPIHDLIELVLPNWESSPDIRTFKEHTSHRRNDLFHNLQGLRQEQVFQAWQSKDYDQWQKKVISCLNFIARQNFNSLKKASLMTSIHKEILKHINNYDL